LKKLREKNVVFTQIFATFYFLIPYSRFKISSAAHSLSMKDFNISYNASLLATGKDWHLSKNTDQLIKTLSQFIHVLFLKK
jgi:hypothetical protein